MSINPLGEGTPNYSSSNDEGSIHNDQGEMNGHSVSSRSSSASSEENVDQVSSSVIGSEGNISGVETTTSHHVNQEQGSEEKKYVEGPDGSLYTVVTKASGDLSGLNDIEGSIKDLVENSEKTEEETKAMEKGLKLTLQSIGKEIQACFKELPGKVQEGLAKAKENLQEVPGKVKEGLTKAKENLQEVPGKVKEGLTKAKENLQAIPGKVQDGLTKAKENLQAIPSKLETPKSKLENFFSKSFGKEGSLEKAESYNWVYPGELPNEESLVSPSEVTSSDFQERAALSSSQEALVLDDTSPQRSVYATFTEARNTLHDFFSLNRRGNQEEDIREVELRSVAGDSSIDDLEKELNRLDEDVKSLGDRAKDAVRTFFDSVRQKLTALLQFLRSLFSRSFSQEETSSVGTREETSSINETEESKTSKVQQENMAKHMLYLDELKNALDKRDPTRRNTL